MKTLPEIYVPCENCGFATAINKRTQKAIAKELIGCLPEKKYILHLTGNEFREAHGFNQALDEVRARLTAFIGHKEQ